MESGQGWANLAESVQRHWDKKRHIWVWEMERKPVSLQNRRKEEGGTDDEEEVNSVLGMQDVRKRICA